MGVFNKLVNILFDEPEEIPVITKTKEEKKPKKVEEKFDDDEVIVTKVEKNSIDETDDMPKFKEEKKEEETKTFTFPLIDDDDDEIIEEPKTRHSRSQETRSSRGYEYLSSTDYTKKSDSYTSSRNNIYDSKDDKKPFTLSPIISPVYGILNENYKKEDIIERDNSSKRISYEKVDLDSVRRKAYGTLEDEIEASLNKTKDMTDVLDEVPESDDMTLDTLSDDGLSINDLLVDYDEEDEKGSAELFDIGTEEIEAEPEIDLEQDSDTKYVESEIKEDSDEEDDDIFNLIDSISSGKDEEE